jgi:rRNA maturation endonuclease Nob1
VIIAITCVLAIVVIVFVLGVRPKDLPEPEPVSPFAHLDERKAAIYENLRDLQFEYRVGKLSDNDYQLTKKDLQKELATVMAEVDRVKAQLGLKVQNAPVAKVVKVADALTCPHCNARFEQELKFCGECGKPMKAVRA